MHMSPTVFRTANLDIRIYPKDHQPPHVHVVGPDKVQAKFSLEPVVCLSSVGFSKKSLNKIALFIKLNQEHLLEVWHEYQG